jgi:signal transduction histidine kinase
MQRSVSRRARKKGLELELRYEPTELEVYVDADLVEFLLESLLEAAMKCRENGNLLLRAADAGDVVQVELVDNRRSIDSQTVAEMFTPSRNNINSDGGVDGMEYLVAKEIIRLHEDITGKRGGRIEARSDVSGTVIMFTLLK